MRTLFNILLVMVTIFVVVEPAFTDSNADRITPTFESRAPVDRFSIASFNLQAFRLQDTDTVDIGLLAELISRFEIAALQNTDGTNDAVALLDNILSSVNAFGNDYDYLLGPGVGDTNTHYAFIFRSDMAVPTQWYTFTESGTDTFRWPPFIARFQLGEDGFDVTFANIFVDPDFRSREIDALPVLGDSIKKAFPDETDIILLGDMDSDCQDPQVENLFKSLDQENYIGLISTEMAANTDPSVCRHAQIIVASYSDELFWEESGILRIDWEVDSALQRSTNESNSAPGFTALAIVGDDDDPETEGSQSGGFCFFKSSSN